MENGGFVYSHDYDWAAELRARVPAIINQLKSIDLSLISQEVRDGLIPYLLKFADEANKPMPDRSALAGRVVREFSIQLSSRRSQLKDKLWRDFIDVVNIIYLQPTAILFTPPDSTHTAGAGMPVPWQGNAVALSPARRFQWPFLAPFTRRRVT